MERLMHVVPSLKYKRQLLEYIEEHERYGSHMNGAGGLNRYKDDIEGWLQKLEEDKKGHPDSGKVPTVTYMLVRESDDRLIGMINIRLVLNDELQRLGGHIGYGIRPSERQKGYNKINLYLGLKKCYEANLDVVLLDCIKSNEGSRKTMIALGGKLVNEYYDNTKYNDTILRYAIDVKESLKKYASSYEDKVCIRSNR